MDIPDDIEREGQAKSRLVHGIRNPITSVSGVARLLQKKVNNDEIAKYLDVILKESTKMEDFLEDAFDEVSLAANRAKIIRSIEFKPEHKQAGLSILSYFGQIISQKYPDSNSMFRIEQRDKSVALIIEIDEGEVERIEKSLELYGMVVCGQAKPSDLLSNERDILELKHKLEISSMELRLTKELHNQYKETQNKRIENLENEIIELRSFLGNSISSYSKIRDEFIVLIKQNENNKEIVSALKILVQALTKESQPESTSKIDEALITIKDSDPRLFGRLNDLLIGTLASTGGGTLTHWIVSVLNCLPK